MISSIRRTVRPATRMWSPPPPGIDLVRRPAQPPSDRELMSDGCQATADSSSVIEVVECYAWTAGPTTQRLPGNSMACGWPGLVAARGGRTIIPGERFGLECPRVCRRVDRRARPAAPQRWGVESSVARGSASHKPAAIRAWVPPAAPAAGHRTDLRVTVRRPRQAVAPS